MTNLEKAMVLTLNNCFNTTISAQVNQGFIRPCIGTKTHKCAAYIGVDNGMPAKLRLNLSGLLKVHRGFIDNLCGDRNTNIIVFSIEPRKFSVTVYKAYDLKVTPFHIYDKVPTIDELPPFIPLDDGIHDVMYDHVKFLKDLYVWADKDFEALAGLLCPVDAKILHGYLELA